jgi:hypothetical protein
MGWHDAGGKEGCRKQPSDFFWCWMCHYLLGIVLLLVLGILSPHGLRTKFWPLKTRRKIGEWVVNGW